MDHPDALSPATAISVFIRWLDAVAPVRRDRVVWAWGADYDFPILTPYIDLRGPLDMPWHFHQQRCARTIWKIAFPEHPSPVRPHNAIGDVRSTVLNVHEAYAVFSVGLKQQAPPATSPPPLRSATDSGAMLPGR